MSVHDYTSVADIEEITTPMFTMSMYATREDLYKAKSEYYGVQLESLAQLLRDCHQPAVDAGDLELVSRLYTAVTMLEEI